MPHDLTVKFSGDVNRPEDYFKCTPYDAVLSARACQRRRAAAADDKKIDYFKCLACDVGNGIATRLALNGHTVSPPQLKPAKRRNLKVLLDEVEKDSSSRKMGTQQAFFLAAMESAMPDLPAGFPKPTLVFNGTTTLPEVPLAVCVWCPAPVTTTDKDNRPSCKTHQHYSNTLCWKTDCDRFQWPHQPWPDPLSDVKLCMAHRRNLVAADRKAKGLPPLRALPTVEGKKEEPLEYKVPENLNSTIFQLSDLADAAPVSIGPSGVALPMSAIEALVRSFRIVALFGEGLIGKLAEALTNGSLPQVYQIPDETAVTELMAARTLVDKLGPEIEAALDQAIKKAKKT